MQWMVLEACTLSKHLQSDKNFATAFFGSDEASRQSTIDALNSWGYDEAAKEVYGETYTEWKSRHQQKKTTGEQL